MLICILQCFISAILTSSWPVTRSLHVKLVKDELPISHNIQHISPHSLLDCLGLTFSLVYPTRRVIGYPHLCICLGLWKLSFEMISIKTLHISCSCLITFNVAGLIKNHFHLRIFYTYKCQHYTDVTIRRITWELSLKLHYILENLDTSYNFI